MDGTLSYRKAKHLLGSTLWVFSRAGKVADRGKCPLLSAKACLQGILTFD